MAALTIMFRENTSAFKRAQLGIKVAFIYDFMFLCIYRYMSISALLFVLNICSYVVLTCNICSFL